MLKKLFNCFNKQQPLPPYVERENDMCFPGPIVVEKAALNCFVVKIDPDKVSTLLQKTFSQPSNGAVKYIPVTNYGLVVLGDMPKLYSSKIDVGWTTEKELTIWILAAAVDTKSKNDQIDKLVLFPAYVVADDPYSLVSGREALGFFKSWGSLDGVKDNGSAPDKLSVSVFGHQVKGDQAAYHPVINFSKSQSAADEFSMLSSLEDIIEYLLKILREIDDCFHADFTPDWQLFETLFRDMWKHQFPIALLKQIRDSGGTSAVYQAILESEAKIISFDHIKYLGKYQFLLNSIFSFRPDETLGIAPSDEPYHGFRMVLDFQINGGNEIWKA